MVICIEVDVMHVLSRRLLVLSQPESMNLMSTRSLRDADRVHDEPNGCEYYFASFHILAVIFKTIRPWRIS